MSIRTSRTSRAARAALPILLIALCSLPATALAAPTLVQIAREFTGGLMWLDPGQFPALSEDGTVAFVGSDDFDVFDGTHVFVGDGGALTKLDFSTASLSNVTALAVTDLGQVMIGATHAGVPNYRGVYTTTVATGTFATYYEGAVQMPMQGVPTPVNYNAAMAQNGTIAFSTIVNGFGGIYRGAFGGAPSVLRAGSGTFYNTMRIDVNDAGQVPAQMEYFDPTAGLTRAILLSETPGQTLQASDTALERLGIGAQPQPVINGLGQVAFSYNGTLTMRFFDPPGVSGPVYEEVVLPPGVYISEPGPWSIAKHPTLIAGNANGYTDFGRVDLNDMGEVAFEATANGEHGVFVGPDPVADKVLASGDVRGNQLFSIVGLGELNNAGEISIWTSDFNSTDRQVWRVDGTFDPPPPPPPPPTPRPIDRIRELIRLILRAIFGR